MSNTKNLVRRMQTINESFKKKSINEEEKSLADMSEDELKALVDAGGDQAEAAKSELETRKTKADTAGA